MTNAESCTAPDGREIAAAQRAKAGLDWGTISSIDVGRPESWRERLFLTIDIDWAHDDVIAEVLHILEDRDVSATWYITHDTPLLARLRENPRFELGIHPNFNALLLGREDNGSNATDVVQRLMDLVPEATSVRSHSLTIGSQILEVFHSAGLTHECNHLVPYQNNIVLQPWRCWTTLTRVPHFWEDDIALLDPEPASIQSLAERDGLRVFDFHPIHIVLNTDRISRYEEARPYFRDFPALKKCANVGGLGVKDHLLDLLNVVRCDTR